MIRVWECSLAGCLGRGDDPHGNAFLDRCVGRELAVGGVGRQGRVTNARPASMLRWDVPAAIYAGGRCTNPAGHEWDKWPPAVQSVPGATQDEHGWQREGFSGHNVTQMGVGWVLHPLPVERRDVAFGHDAWTYAPRRSGSWPGADNPSCKPLPRASWGAFNTGHSYAEARYAALQAAPPLHRVKAPPPRGEARRQAAAWKWGFVNTSTNCYHWEWERALADQRAYALLLAERQGQRQGPQPNGEPPRLPTFEAGECSVWGSLYNQVHVGWNESYIHAIFYVNDTLTPLRYPAFASSASDRSFAAALKALAGARQMRRRLVRDALAAADRALVVAMTAQRILAQRGLSLPIVQYAHTDECGGEDGLADLAARLKFVGTSGKQADWNTTWTQRKMARSVARAVFLVPRASARRAV